MARLPRFVISGQPQHVIIRGNNREPIFCDDSNYRLFPEKISQACKNYDCEIHGHVLMTNHIHLLITPNAEQSIGKAIQSIGRYYVHYFNYVYTTHRHLMGWALPGYFVPGTSN